MLPDISNILETVDRQMLLVLKTNDLLRGIETALKTQKRMTAYWVMAKCCIRSTSQEEIEKAESSLKKFGSVIVMNWTILKINLLYLFNGIMHMNLYSTLKLLFT